MRKLGSEKVMSLVKCLNNKDLKAMRQLAHERMLETDFGAPEVKAFTLLDDACLERGMETL